MRPVAPLPLPAAAEISSLKSSSICFICRRVSRLVFAAWSAKLDEVLVEELLELEEALSLFFRCFFSFFSFFRRFLSSLAWCLCHQFSFRFRFLCEPEPAMALRT